MKHRITANAAMENFIESLSESLASLVDLVSEKRQKRVKHSSRIVSLWPAITAVK